MLERILFYFVITIVFVSCNSSISLNYVSKTQFEKLYETESIGQGEIKFSKGFYYQFQGFIEKTR